MKQKNLFSRFVLGTALLAGTVYGLSGCGSQSADDGTVEITYWAPRGEDSSFYEEYEDNPIIKYIEKNYTFNDKKIHLDFFIAPPGSESDDFSTLLGTGDYCDVMDMSMATSSASELYEEGITWDLTDLVKEHMPNYMAFLEANQECREAAYTIVDGEKKILQLYAFSDGIQPNFQGFCYRRDWVARYGKNPQTGEAFTYGFTDVDDPESWQDDVVFPNGTDEPIYISDWEWMFGIFEEALADQGIEDGYCYSMFYLGYMPTGDLYSGFGGGAPTWYQDGDTCVFGVTTKSFQAYLQCLNSWYEKGWLDQSFAEHTGDMFFAVDAAKVFQGKVGLWQGRVSTVGTQIDADDSLTDGAVVYGCRQPINDIYGSAEQQNKEPNAMFQYSKVGAPVCITKKLDEEEVVTFLKFADFLYSEEGSLLKCGFSKSQYEESQDAFYTEHGLTEGLYTIVEEGGESIIRYNLQSSEDVFNPAALARVNLGVGRCKNVDFGYDRYLTQAMGSWDYYVNTASLHTNVSNAVSVEDAQTITKIKANIDQFLARSVGPMIKGSGYDVWDDASFEQFCKDVNKYQAETVTQIYQKAMDLVAE